MYIMSFLGRLGVPESAPTALLTALTALDPHVARTGVRMTSTATSSTLDVQR